MEMKGGDKKAGGGGVGNERNQRTGKEREGGTWRET